MKKSTACLARRSINIIVVLDFVQGYTPDTLLLMNSGWLACSGELGADEGGSQYQINTTTLSQLKKLLKTPKAKCSTLAKYTNLFKKKTGQKKGKLKCKIHIKDDRSLVQRL